MTQIIACDVETFRIGPGAVAPKVVCATFAERTAADGVDTELPQFEVELWGNGDPQLPQFLKYLFENEEVLTVWHNGAYDLTCIMGTWPEMIPAIFSAVMGGRVTDTQLREKELALSTHGHVDDYKSPDGGRVRLGFSLADIVLKRLGEDRKAAKEDEDSWRLNYNLLDGKKASEYPMEALEYAKTDALDTLRVYYDQEASQSGDPDYRAIHVDRQRSAFAFALQLATCVGVATNQEMVAEIEAIVKSELAPENIALLFTSGVLRRAVPPRPHAKGTINHGPDCDRKANCICPPKMTAGKDESCNEKLLCELVATTCIVNKLPVKLTETGQKDLKVRKLLPENFDFEEHIKYVSTDQDTVEALADLDPVLSQWQRRQLLSKLVDNQIPLLKGNAIVHVPYNNMNETGRTSTYGSNHKKKLGEKGNLYPAIHGQGVPRIISTQGGTEIDVRRAYMPYEGCTFIDVDFESLELVCVAQTTYDLFGKSKHRDLLLAGVKLHDYLGAQIAWKFASDERARRWQAALRAEKVDDPMTVYHAFTALKKGEGPEAAEWKAFWKNYRMMAKPVGLGFPGGLGPEKLATTIAPQHGVKITTEEARRLREIWHETYPEMRAYFEWVGNQQDHHNEVLAIDDDDEAVQGHWYRTPLGMVRRGATYCATANGRAMQSPGAEAALIGLLEVQRACWDESVGSVLYGCMPWNFVHDQVIAHTTTDKSLWHEQAVEMARLFCHGASQIFTDVPIHAEPMLSDVWSKSAEATYDENQRLIPWTPKD